MSQRVDDPGDHLSPHRLEALTDGVYAIAMTILVLGLEIPKGEDNPEMLHRLMLMGPQLLHYAISFLILGSLWIAHSRQMKTIVRTNATHLWLNILMLMMVCLLPFSTSLISDQPNELAAQAFFHLNMLLVGLAVLAHWSYGVAHGRLVAEGVEPRQYQLGTKLNLVLPLCACLAMALAPVFSNWSSLAYLGIGPLTAHVKSTHARKKP